MKNKLRRIVCYIAILMIAIPLTVRADNPPDFDGDPGIPTPIDGGASLLVGAAAVYGARKLKRKK